MALTLTEAAKLSSNTLQRGVVETITYTGVVLDRLPFKDIEGNAYAYNTENALPGVEFRAVNSSYTESTGTFNQLTETLVILGGDADVDRFIQQTRGNLNDQRAEQERMKAKSVNFKYNDAFINGDTGVDANSFDGLKKRIAAGQIVDAATNGLAVVGADDNARHAFFDVLDQTIGLVANPQAIYMNDLILAKIKSSARRLTMFDQRIDDFGRQIATYRGIDLLDIGTKSDGTTRIIPQTETQGTSTIASSIYVVGFSRDEGEPGVCGLTNGGVMVDDLGMLETKPVFRTRIEFYCGMALFAGKSAARLRGVLNS